MKRLIVALSVAACPLALGVTLDTVEAPYRGEYVPAKASCSSPLRMLVEAKAVIFVNGSQRAEFRKLDQCLSCEGGQSNPQPITWLTTDAAGDSPFTIYIDRAKRKLSVDLRNDKQLGARFPLGTAVLKKCPSTSITRTAP